MNASASLAAIHYSSIRLYRMLKVKQEEHIQELSIVFSIIKECEDNEPEMKQIRLKLCNGVDFESIK